MDRNETQEVNQFFDCLDKTVPGGDVHALKGIGMDRNVYLCPFTMEGLEEMHGYSKDSRLYQYFTFPPHVTLSDTEQYMHKLLGRMGSVVSGRTAMYWFIRRISDQKLLGSFGLTDISYEYQSCEWGYGIDPDEWGKGYILEVQEIAKDYVFNELLLNRLHGKTRADNGPTLASIYSAGFEQEGVLRDFYRDHLGRYFDAVVYSLLSDEYRQQRAIVNQSAGNQATGNQAAQGVAGGVAGVVPGAVFDTAKARKLILSVLEITDVQDLGIDSDWSMDEICEWDSYHHIQVISAVQEQTGIRFTPKEIAEATSVKKIVGFVSEKKGKILL